MHRSFAACSGQIEHRLWLALSQSVFGTRARGNFAFHDFNSHLSIRADHQSRFSVDMQTTPQRDRHGTATELYS